MRSTEIILAMAILCAPSLVAQQQTAADAFAAALENVPHELQGAPPYQCDTDQQVWKCVDPRSRHKVEMPADAIVVAQKTIGGAPAGYRAFVERHFGSVIAQELVQSYGSSGPASLTIDQETAGGFAVLTLEPFERGPFDYDWQRLNQQFPGVRWVVRLSRPATDRMGTVAVVRYELIGRDRPPALEGSQPWQWASFVELVKQPDGSWKRDLAVVGNLWK